MLTGVMMRNSMKLMPVLLIMTGLILALSACDGVIAVPDEQAELDKAVAQTLTAYPLATETATATATPEPTLSATQPVEQYGPTNFPTDVNPLTGLQVSDPNILNRRPVMIKVSNYPRNGRPHAGLSYADIVFDYYLGVHMNRYMGLYYGQDATQVGPIRSGRLVDRWLVSMYQGVLGMEYADAYVYGKILDKLGYSRAISSSTDTCPAICSNTNPQTITSVFANTAEFSKFYAKKPSASNTRQNLDGMAFNSIPPSGGVAANEFTMQYSDISIGNWKYDPGTRKYLRWVEDEPKEPGEITLIPLIDRLNEQQLKFSNVVILFAEIERLNSADTLHEIHIANTVGRALILRDGQMYDVTYKSGDDHPIQFFDKADKVFELQPGNTWISITGTNSQLKEKSSAVFRVTLGLP